MVIRKIFSGIMDEEVHSDFLKFGKGEFKDRYLVEIKKQKDKWAIKTSAEFANFLVKKCLETAEKVNIKGIIVATFDLRNEINFEIKKVGNFQGIRKHEIDTEVYSKEVLNLMEKYPRVFFALSFSTPICDLKIKAKAPKSGKPGNKEEEPKPDFCSLKTNNSEIIKELLFDISGEDVKIKHTIKINEIIYPKEKELKPEEIREKSKRKGVIIREINSNGKKIIKQAVFEV